MDFNRKVDPTKYSATDMPTYPARYLTYHCAVKGVQVGSIFGLLALPVYKFYRKVPFSTAYLVTMNTIPLTGMLLSLGLLYSKHAFGALDEDGVDDRAYRLSKNVGQTTVDIYSTVGYLAAVSFSVICGKTGLMWLSAASYAGVSAGVLTYGIQKAGVINKISQVSNSNEK